MKHISFFKLLLCSLVFLCACRAEPVPEPTPVPTATARPRPKPTPTPVPVRPRNTTADGRIKKDVFVSLISYAQVGEPSRVTGDLDGYTAEWILKSTEETVCSCVLTYPYSSKKKAIYSDIKCSDGPGMRAYESGDTELAWYPNMPGVGIRYTPNGRRDYSSVSILGMHSDVNCTLNGDVYCTFMWYAETEDGAVPMYEADTVNREIVQTEIYHEELWQKYRTAPSSVHILSYDEYLHKEGNTQAYYDWEYAQDSEKESTHTYCEEGIDYLDMYDAYEDEFDDEEDAYDYWMEYCE